VTRADAQPAAPELPSIDSLKGLESEYRDFLQPAVGEDVRRAALKKLFQDPHFNVMDGLDVYIDDYSKPDPIPESMLKTLAHAKRLLFTEQTDTEEDAKAQQVPAPKAPPAIAGETATSNAPPASVPPEDEKAKS
jgi:hypothetical protein